MLHAIRSRWHEVRNALCGNSPRAVIFVDRKNGLHHHNDWHATSVVMQNQFSVLQMHLREVLADQTDRAHHASVIG